MRGIVVQKTEKRGEIASGEAWEERHCSELRLRNLDDAISLRELVGNAVVLHRSVCLLAVLVDDDEGQRWNGALSLYPEPTLQAGVLADTRVYQNMLAGSHDHFTTPLPTSPESTIVVS